ncbi:glycosyltransferase family 4 protein [Chelativorans salis]|uniref:Glycosyltransferase family 4 protein n=1 Tax=Chelativorans salis TaxID=2978478 RepID=A0ABT2LXV1_9HYPH|nr:glycosyltransferase family 4 protein [Chelativorans sp. EGI FJ00035]MCT7378213.1 glycosyltransferase family 4 protein [Chelativorans sp. EGI FJ00035]
MKHVWIVNHYAEEPGGAGGTRHFSLAKYLRAHGWKATIIGASTEHLSGRQRLDAKERARLEHHCGIPFLWLKTPPYSGNGLDRIRNMLTFTWRLLLPANVSSLEPPDLIIGSSVHPFAAWAALQLARRHRVPFVFEVRDLWPQALIDMGRLTEKSVTTFLMRALEKHLYRSAETIVVAWPNAGSYIQGLGIEADKVVWVSNGIDLAEWSSDIPLRDSSYFTLMYFGAHGGANSLDNVIRAMRLVEMDSRGENIRLRLIGHGPQKPALRELARELGLARISFEDPVPNSAIPGLAAEADAFVFSLIDAPMFKYGISPRKLYDFMAARRPVVFCCGAANNPVDECGGGVTVPPGNPELLAEAILKLAELSPSARATMGAAARQHVEVHYSYQMLAQKLSMTLDQHLPTAAGKK